MNEVSVSIPSHLTDLPQKAEKAKNVMGKDDFMKLLMTQLQNQDPLKPMDHHEFAAQLAQFGSLEQLQNIQKSIESLHTGYGEGAKFNALGLIGKKVDASSSEVDLIGGQNVSLRFNRKEEVQPTNAVVYGDGGKIVREIAIDPRTRTSDIEWDGKDQDGKQLPSGKYTFRVQGTDKTGQATELSSELSGRVTGVDMNGKSPMLVVKTASGDIKIDIAKIKNVANDDKGTDAPDKSKLQAEAKIPMIQRPVIVQTDGEDSDGGDRESTLERDDGMWSGIPGGIPMGGFKP